MTLTDEEYLRMTAEHNNNNYSEECRGMNKCVFIVKDGKCISNTNDNSSSNVILSKKVQIHAFLFLFKKYISC